MDSQGGFAPQKEIRMSNTLVRRVGNVCFGSLALVLLIAATGCQGPPGPAGPPGSSSGGGPPYVWICTPAHLPNAGGGPRDDVYVLNGSGSTANIAVNILGRDGNNLAGVTIPGSNPAKTYPGEAGATTVTLASGHTRDVDWVMPVTSPDGITNVAFSVRVTSDQPIVVGANFQFNGNLPSQCSLLPK
jgi:hypothetical protein